MKVEQILTTKGTDVYAIRENDRVSDAVSMLNTRNVGALIVHDAAESVVGILSERDVVRHLGERGSAVLDEPVGACMTANVITCTPETKVQDLMGAMTDKRIRHLPVTRDGKIVGVVSIGDVVKRKIEETEQEAQALREYISS